jgi:precorrin-6A synthase
VRKILVIGIGAGSPEHLTVEAIEALNRADVFFLLDKGQEKDALLAVRREICERFIRDPRYRIVQVADPVRDKAEGKYKAGVVSWHRERAELLGALIAEEVGEDKCGAFLVWGDPAWYDSTIRIVEAIREGGVVDFDYDVIPGISSFQVLSARFRLPMNEIGEPVVITTGRKLREGFPAGATSVVVMLDGECSFKAIPADGIDIYWGAYLGMKDEVLISGPLKDVGPEIERVRAEARAAHGWIMDVYLLRRAQPRRHTEARR